MLLSWIWKDVVFFITVALPVSTECLTEGLQIKLSNIFMGRASGNNIAVLLSALFVGQTFVALTAYPIAEGFGVYVNVLCSQAYGAKQYKLVGLYFYRALFMAALTCFPVFTVFISVRPIVYLLFQDWELAQYTGSFTDVLCFGYPAYLYYKIGFRFLQALNIVWGPVLYLIIGNILNGVIQYILIFQYNTTLAGAADGYVISNYLVALLVFTHIQLSRVHTLIAHKWTIEYISNWLHTARYAIFPILQFVLGSVPLTILPLLFIGLIAGNQRELAIFSILYAIGWVLSLAIMGLSSSVTCRVGKLLGANEPKSARRSAIVAIVLGELTLIICTGFLLAVSAPLAHLFTTNESILKELIWNIRILSFLIHNSMIFVFQGIMNACCKQRTQMVLKFITQIIIGTICTALLVHFVSWKALGIYVQFFIGAFLYCIIASFFLFCCDWKKFSLAARGNIRVTIETTELRETSGNITSSGSLMETKLFNVIRYLACLGLNILLFSIVIILITYCV